MVPALFPCFQGIPGYLHGPMALKVHQEFPPRLAYWSMLGSSSDLQTHPNLHSPILSRAKRHRSNTPKCVASHPNLYPLAGDDHRLTYSNGAVQIRVGLELAELPSADMQLHVVTINLPDICCKSFFQLSKVLLQDDWRRRLRPSLGSDGDLT